MFFFGEEFIIKFYMEFDNRKIIRVFIKRIFIKEFLKVIGNIRFLYLLKVVIF